MCNCLTKLCLLEVDHSVQQHIPIKIIEIAESVYGINSSWFLSWKLNYEQTYTKNRENNSRIVNISYMYMEQKNGDNLYSCTHVVHLQTNILIYDVNNDYC